MKDLDKMKEEIKNLWVIDLTIVGINDKIEKLKSHKPQTISESNFEKLKMYNEKLKELNEELDKAQRERNELQDQISNDYDKDITYLFSYSEYNIVVRKSNNHITLKNVSEEEFRELKSVTLI